MITVERIRNTSATVLHFEDGNEVLISYDTPVAAYSPVSGYYRTSKRYSNTTSRQINEYLRGVEAKEVTPAFLEGFLDAVKGKNNE